MELILSNAGADITVGTCEFLLFKLDRHYKAYELSVNLQFCKFEAMDATGKRFRFTAADCWTIIDEFDSIDWRTLFTSKIVDRCVDLFYDYVVLFRGLCQ
jgi:hypothetical protein